SVHKAKFKGDVSGFRPLTRDEIELVNNNPSSFQMMPTQEKGVRSACALPYQLFANGNLSEDKKSFTINFHASSEVFGRKAAGSPFNVYAARPYKKENESSLGQNWSYAVASGYTLTDSWHLDAFENGIYHLCVYGPNGFYREFSGTEEDPRVNFRCDYESSNKKLTGNLELRMANLSRSPVTITIEDNAYKYPMETKVIAAKDQVKLIMNLAKSFRWYDFTVRVKEAPHFLQRYAGRVETGDHGYTDPAMGHSVG
ncbi:MAG: phospholipase C, phosphocholine-specific, partial [Marivirga sp.]|nr:phospholipase C, phosphocholine-specific [Marivirga sp.]